MRKKRTPIMLALAGLIASLITFVSSGTAVAAEVPMQLVGTPIAQGGGYATSPNGNLTVGCNPWSGQDLTTYDQSGAVVQQIDRTQQIDGKPNCVFRPAVDKNGDVYGRQYQNGKVLAYDGNTVKWQYPIQCSATDTSVAVGSDGNIYALTTESGRHAPDRAVTRGCARSGSAGQGTGCQGRRNMWRGSHHLQGWHHPGDIRHGTGLPLLQLRR